MRCWTSRPVARLRHSLSVLVEQGGLIAGALAHHVTELQLVGITGKAGDREVVGRRYHLYLAVRRRMGDEIERPVVAAIPLLQCLRQGGASFSRVRIIQGKGIGLSR